MVVTCDIEFEGNPSGTFYAGQNIPGTITLKLDKPKDVKAITLKITGFAKTVWWEDEFGDSKMFVGLEKYISHLITLVNPEKASKLRLEAGTYRYNFDFKLPENCPSSLETANAKIMYSLKVSIVRPWKFNQNFTRGITVLCIHDLNVCEASAWLRQPTTVQMGKAFGFGSNTMDTLQLKANLAQSGFVPGQRIPINLIVDNASQVDVEFIKVNLFMILLCLSNGVREKSKKNPVMVTKLKGEGVLRHCKKVFDYELEIPATPPTCLNCCSVIKVSYEVHIEAAVKGWHASPVLTVPITIGNVPFKTDKNKLELLNGTEEVDGACCLVNQSFDAPPSYEEAIHISHMRLQADEAHDYGDDNFSPRYPVFHFDGTK